jgi:hypothetical protein
MAKKKPTHHEVAVSVIDARILKKAYTTAENAYFNAGSAWLQVSNSSDGITQFMLREVVDALIADGWRKE